MNSAFSLSLCPLLMLSIFVCISFTFSPAYLSSISFQLTLVERSLYILYNLSVSSLSFISLGPCSAKNASFAFFAFACASLDALMNAFSAAGYSFAAFCHLANCALSVVTFCPTGAKSLESLCHFSSALTYSGYSYLHTARRARAPLLLTQRAS